MTSQPFFSIIIPTYNRSLELQSTIKSFLEQDFKNIEILIFDNHSDDDTMEIVKKIHDLRIKYIKNHSNIGLTKNIQKAILSAKGTYIITQGDDDILLFKDTLSKVYNLILKKNIGFVRLNILSKDRSNRKIKHVWIEEKKNLYIGPNSNALEIVNFLEKTNGIFISGLVFKNEDIHKSDFITSELSPWFNILFNQIVKYGGYFAFELFIIASWSGPGDACIFLDKKTKEPFFVNYYINITKNLLNHQESKIYKEIFYKRVVKESFFILPAIKYVSNNKNLIDYKDGLKKFDNDISSNIKLEAIFILSKLLPKYFIGLMRNNIHLMRKDTKLFLSDIANNSRVKVIEKRYEEIVIKQSSNEVRG